MNKFLIGVADVWLYADAQCTSLIATAKTMTNNTIDVTNTSVDIQGGKGNKLLKRFFTSAMANVTLTDTRFNLGMMAANWGEEVMSTFSTRKQEAVTLNGYKGTLTGTPVGVNGGSAIAYIEYNGEVNQKSIIVGSNKEFTIDASYGIPQNAKVCVSYFAVNADAKYVTIPAEIAPKVVYAVFEANLASNEAGEGIIGRATIIIPSLQLSGNQSISLTADGYSTQDLSGTALAFTPMDADNPCANQDIYGYVIEEIYGNNWYDEVKALIVQDMNAASGVSVPLVVYAFNGEYSFPLSDAQLDSDKLTITGGASVTYTKATHTVSATATGKVTVKLTKTDGTIVQDEGTITIA